MLETMEIRWMLEKTGYSGMLETAETARMFENMESP